MTSFSDKLKVWVYAGIQANNGEARVAEVAKYIWENHEQDLRQSGDHFFTWQYEMRWAGQRLQKEGKIVKEKPPRGWRLTR